MMGDDYAQLLSAEGLPGWRASVRYGARWTASLTPPGAASNSITCRGRDQADALARAIARAKAARAKGGRR